MCILVQLYSVVNEDFEMSDEQQLDLENMLGEAFHEDLEHLPEYIIKDLIGIYDIYIYKYLFNLPVVCQVSICIVLFIFSQFFFFFCNLMHILEMGSF